MPEINVATEVSTSVLNKCRRRCCLCFYQDGNDAIQQGQVVPIAADGGAEEDNMVFLCFRHQRSGRMQKIQALDLRFARSAIHRYIQSTAYMDGKNNVSMLDRGATLPEFVFAVLRINMPFDNWTREREHEFLGALRGILGVHHNASIVARARGSVLLKLHLSSAEYLTLSRAVHTGTLGAYSVTGMQLLGPAPNEVSAPLPGKARSSVWSEKPTTRPTLRGRARAEAAIHASLHELNNGKIEALSLLCIELTEVPSTLLMPPVIDDLPTLSAQLHSEVARRLLEILKERQPENPSPLILLSPGVFGIPLADTRRNDGAKMLGDILFRFHENPWFCEPEGSGFVRLVSRGALIECHPGEQRSVSALLTNVRADLQAQPWSIRIEEATAPLNSLGENDKVDALLEAITRASTALRRNGDPLDEYDTELTAETVLMPCLELLVYLQHAKANPDRTHFDNTKSLGDLEAKLRHYLDEIVELRTRAAMKPPTA